MKYLFNVLFLSSLTIGTAQAQTLSARASAPVPASLDAAATPVTPTGQMTSIEREQPNTAKATAPKVPQDKPYKLASIGLYGGINGTNYSGQYPDGGKLMGRSGYQFGAFVRAGGRVFGQIGAEYFASSADYFVQGDGASVNDVRDRINVKYLQVPVYIGYKLVQSDRGLSAIRLQIGAEYANRLSADTNGFNLSKSEIKSGTFNGLGQVGVDFGPVLANVTYHHGFGDSIKENTGFAGSQRRVISISVGLKF